MNLDLAKFDQSLLSSHHQGLLLSFLVALKILETSTQLVHDVSEMPVKVGGETLVLILSQLHSHFDEIVWAQDRGLF